MKSGVMSRHPPPPPLRRTPPPLPPRSNSNTSNASILSNTSTASSTSNTSIANNPPSSANSNNSGSSEFSASYLNHVPTPTSTTSSLQNRVSASEGADHRLSEETGSFDAMVTSSRDPSCPNRDGGDEANDDQRLENNSSTAATDRHPSEQPLPNSTTSNINNNNKAATSPDTAAAADGDDVNTGVTTTLKSPKSSSTLPLTSRRYPTSPSQTTRPGAERQSPTIPSVSNSASSYPNSSNSSNNNTNSPGYGGDTRATCSSARMGSIPQHSSLSETGTTPTKHFVPQCGGLVSPPLPPILQQFMDGEDEESNPGGGKVEIVSGVGILVGGIRGGSGPGGILNGAGGSSTNRGSLLVNGGGARSKSCSSRGGTAGDGGHDRPTVSFDPNPTILLTTEENRSPMKADGKKALDAPSRPAPNQSSEDCHLKDLYQQVSAVVASNPDEREAVNEDEAEDPAAVPMIWISKWVDYSDKYGLGYQLCDDSIGVLFNDFTKLQLLPDGENIHYIERNLAEHYHTLTEYPQTLYKKVTLLRYFRNYMNEHLLKAGATMCPREGDELARIPSLRTYFRTRSAIVLHLTNGTLQMNFFEDHTKIILCPLMGAVTYIDQKRNFRTYKLGLIQEHGCNADLASRLKYARNMIQKMMLTRSTTESATSSAGTAPASATTSASRSAKAAVPTV